MEDRSQFSSFFSAAGENFENYGKLEARFLPFSAPQAKIFRNLEGQEARFSLLIVKSSMEKVGFRVGFSKFSSGRVSGRKKVRVSGIGFRVTRDIPDVSSLLKIFDH